MARRGFVPQLWRVGGFLLLIAGSPLAAPYAPDEVEKAAAPAATEAPASLADEIGKAPIGEALPIGTILFPPDRSTLDVAARAQLARVIAAVRAAAPKDYAIAVAGYADRGDADPANLQLSADRAAGVAEMLRAGLALDAARLTVEGRGATDFPPGFEPRDPRQRRVEITLTRLEPPPVAAPEKPPEPPVVALDWNDVPGAPADAEAVAVTETSEPLVFGLSPMSRVLDSFATIELWASPQWRVKPDHDPLLLEFGDGEAARFSLRIAADRTSFSLWNADAPAALAVDYDFTRPKAYHLALLTGGGVTRVMIDGVLLPVDIPIGFGSAAARQLSLGSLDTGEDRFLGKLGRLRVWAGTLAPDEIRRLAVTAGAPPLSSDLYGRLDLIGEAEGGTLLVTEPERNPQPSAVWWQHYGADYVRVQNFNAFANGEDDACTASHLAALDRAGAAPPPCDPTGEPSNATAASNSIYPIFSLEWARSSAIGTPVLVGASGGQAIDAPMAAGTSDPAITYTATEEEVRDAKGNDVTLRRLAGLNVGSRFGGGSGPPLGIRLRTLRAGLPMEQVPSTLEIFSDAAGVIGIRLGSPVNSTGWIGGDPDLYRAAGRAGGTIERQVVPAGADFPGLAMRADVRALPMVEGATRLDDQSAAIRAVGLLPSPGVERPGLILRTETGDATRFERIGPTRYRSLRMTTPLSPCGPPDCRNPVLTVVNDQLFSIEGQVHDFVPAAPFEPPNDKDSFNNTFVSLSKAVNLQANYVGYNIARMDPVHLVDTGSGKMIFDMPDGASTDYHDHNRIFVPNGLFYIPEFTGRYHSSTAEISSVEEFKAVHSTSVGVSLSGELAPAAFNYSRSVTEGRETLTERGNSVTLGRTRAIFYDLVLDKPRMRLSEDFAGQVRRLKDTGDYRTFIEVFGTHYPVAVMYGGLGVLEISYSRDARQSLEEKKIDIAAEASVLLSSETKSRAGASFETSDESQKSYREEIGAEAENFYRVGGTHVSGGSEGWGVGTDGVVPVHVALRPLDELLVKPWFDDDEITDRVRRELRAATTAYLAEAALAARKAGDQARKFYVKVTANRLLCTEGGERGNGNPIVKTLGSAFVRLSSTQRAYDWANDRVQPGPDFNRVERKIEMPFPFTYSCGPRSTDDLFALGLVPQQQREWVVVLDNGAHLTDEFSVQGVFSAAMRSGISGFRFLDEKRRDQTWRSLLCGAGPCDARQFAGARRSISVDFEELDPRDNRRSNLDLCIDAPGKKRKDCAKLQLDLTLEVLKW